MNPVGNEVKIGKDVFTVSPLTAMRSFVLQPRIGPVLAEAGALFFGVVRDVATKAGDDVEVDVRALLESEVDLDKVAASLGRLFGKLAPAELESITRELLAGSTMNGAMLFAAVDGAGDMFNVLLRGRTLDVWKLVWHALRVNYPDFFGALAGSAVLQSAGAASPSAGSSTSPTSGPATASSPGGG